MTRRLEKEEGSERPALDARQGAASGSGPLRLDSRLALRPREAAAALGLSERTFRALLPSLPHIRVGGAVLVPVDALKRWLDEHAKADGDRIDRVVRETLDSLTR